MSIMPSSDRHLQTLMMLMSSLEQTQGLGLGLGLGGRMPEL